MGVSHDLSFDFDDPANGDDYTYEDCRFRTMPLAESCDAD
jgi:hypothetical protein